MSTTAAIGEAQLARAAVTLGGAVRAQRVFAELPDKRQVSADQQRTWIRQMPRDLPMREHPAYDDAPYDLYETATSTVLDAVMRDGVMRDELFAAARAFMRATGAAFLRVGFEDGSELTAHQAQATLYEPRQVGRFFKRTRRVASRAEPI